MPKRLYIVHTRLFGWLQLEQTTVRQCLILMCHSNVYGSTIESYSVNCQLIFEQYTQVTSYYYTLIYESISYVHAFILLGDLKQQPTPQNPPALEKKATRRFQARQLAGGSNSSSQATSRTVRRPVSTAAWSVYECRGTRNLSGGPSKSSPGGAKRVERLQPVTSGVRPFSVDLRNRTIGGVVSRWLGQEPQDQQVRWAPERTNGA